LIFFHSKWLKSCGFQKKYRPCFIIIFKLKNGNFKTRDFSSLIERVLAGVDYIEVPTFKIYNFHIYNFLGLIFASHLKKKNSFNAEIFLILNVAGRNSMTQLTLKCSANKKILKLNVVSAISPCHYVAMVVREMEFRVFNFLFNQRPLFCYWELILAGHRCCTCEQDLVQVEADKNHGD